MKSASALLTIQKFIFLLDDFHYREFTGHLSAINASLPLKLSESIRNSLPHFDDAEELCVKIYGGGEKINKQNFNQLSSYTFRLSAFLAQNYPAYLYHNITGLQNMINLGEKEKADLLAEVLLDIAERVEDFQCQMLVLKFLSQQAFMLKNVALGVKYNTQLLAAMDNERLSLDIQAALREIQDEAADFDTEAKLTELKNYFRRFFSHASPAIRIVSRCACILSIYRFHQTVFGEPESVEIIKTLERDLQNYSYIIFPFLSDIKGSVGYIKLSSPLVDLNSKEGEREYLELNAHYNSVKFWRSYLSFGQLHLIAIQGTRLLSAYHYLIHRSDYNKIISRNDKRWVKSLIEKCEELLNVNIFKLDNEYEVRSLRMLYGALLIISGERNIKTGVDELESMLIAYQQVNMQASTDTIYLCLMIGYFSMKDYDKCAKTFRRYTKIVKDKPVIEANDLKIHAYYYLSQWIISGSKQYVSKMNGLLQEYNQVGSIDTVHKLMDHFEMPLQEA